jgi:glycosyltransferase involved in cell wall biosynthesis
MTAPKIRVARVIARLNVGGPAIHVTLLNAGLPKEKFESILVTGTENEGEGSMLSYTLEHGVQPVNVPEIVGEASLKLRDLLALFKLYKLFRQFRPHIVHTHTAKAGFLGRVAARLAGVPYVVHTYHGHILYGYYGPLKNLLLRWLETFCGWLSTAIIAISAQVKDDLVRYGVAPAQKIHIIPLGLELDAFLNCEKHRGKFRSELNVASDIPLIGIVGRIFPIKNHRLFLEAAAKVHTRVPHARFVIVGDGILRADMEAYAKELNLTANVIFTGWRRDLTRIYADLTTLVISSDNEGTPVSAIEAMASGCAVVATRVGGLPDIITDGETGLLVPPQDSESLAAAILQLIQNSDQAKYLASNARELARQRFAHQRLIADMENFYLQLVKDCPAL